jgi:hypothetical protein
MPAEYRIAFSKKLSSRRYEQVGMHASRATKTGKHA